MDMDMDMDPDMDLALPDLDSVLPDLDSVFPDLDSVLPDLDSVLPDPAGSIFGLKSRYPDKSTDMDLFFALRFKRHGQGSVHALGK